MEKLLFTPLPPEEALRRLQANTRKDQLFFQDVRESFFYGTLEGNRFTLSDNDGMTNSFRAMLHGTVLPSAAGSLLQIRLSPFPAGKWAPLVLDVVAFLLVILLLAAGQAAEAFPLIVIFPVLAAAIHLFSKIAFRRSAKEALQSLRQLLDAVDAE